jgi:hypothetical protein
MNGSDGREFVLRVVRRPGQDLGRAVTAITRRSQGQIVGRAQDVNDERCFPHRRESLIDCHAIGSTCGFEAPPFVPIDHRGSVGQLSGVESGKDPARTA